MQAIQRGEGRLVEQRGEGHGVDNGLNRGRVEVVVDDVDKIPAHDVPSPVTNKDKQPEHYSSTCKLNAKSIHTVVVEGRPTITIEKWAMTLWHQQGIIHVGCLRKYNQ